MFSQAAFAHRDLLWHTGNWDRRGATRSEVASGSSVPMSYTLGYCAYAYVATVFRAAANATPTPTSTPSATPTITATVPTPPSGVIWRKYYYVVPPERPRPRSVL